MQLIALFEVGKWKEEMMGKLTPMNGIQYLHKTFDITNIHSQQYTSHNNKNKSIKTVLKVLIRTLKIHHNKK
jgi:hypothetical protein